MAKVMLVDDSENFRKPVAAALERRGHTVTALASGAQALQAMHEEKPDLLVLDLMMPSVDGITVLRSLRSRAELKDLPVIVLTAKDNEKAMIEVRQLHAQCLLKYCITLEELCERVTERLALKPVAAAVG